LRTEESVSRRVRHAVRYARVTATAVVTVATAGALAVAAHAEGCPNEAVRAREPYAQALPDCRAYEQVTPVEKDGSTPTGGDSLVQASLSGDRITFLVPADMPGGGGSGTFPLFLASRDAGLWTSQGLLPPTPPGFASTAEVLGWSEDISQALVEGHLEGDTGESVSLYLRDSVTGSYKRVVTAPPFSAHLAGFGAADHSRLFFEDASQLLPSAAPEKSNLYEFNRANGTLSLVGVLPADLGGGAPPGGSFAGPYNWEESNTKLGGATRGHYTQSAISGDGTRVFFTAGETGQVYLRENGTSTLQVSASQRTTPDPNGAKPAAFMAAIPDGSKVFFASCEKLTNDSTAVSTGAATCGEEAQGQDLYEYDLLSGALHDLTVDSNGGDALGAAVQGVLGGSADGSYVYFVGNGVLPNSGASSPGTCHLVKRNGSCNLYVWHNGTVTFIATLNAGETPNSEGESDVLDWKAGPQGVTLVEKGSRVTPDGKTLLFSSTQKLTAYDNRGVVELYRYDATRAVAPGNPACVSCDPTGAPPRESLERNRRMLETVRSGDLSVPALASSLTRNLSGDGSRVFFSTPDALVAQDTNNTFDVYEWEKAGAGSCLPASATFEQGSDGCLYLISTGRSPDPSYFADASASGDNAFFFTDQPLVGQDRDSLIDVYSARVGGGTAEQNPALQTPCAGEACRGMVGAPPAFSAPSSAMFSGTGNLIPPASTPVTPRTASQIRVERLARALRTCRKKHRNQRRACESKAQRRYGVASTHRKRSR
jgi:WD40 repeat protein